MRGLWRGDRSRARRVRGRPLVAPDVFQTGREVRKIQMHKYRLIAASVVGLAVVVVAILMFASLTTIHPGHVGVSVKKCGGGGVAPDPVPTGYYWRSLFCEEVVEYTTNVRTLVLA